MSYCVVSQYRPPRCAPKVLSQNERLIWPLTESCHYTKPPANVGIQAPANVSIGPWRKICDLWEVVLVWLCGCVFVVVSLWLCLDVSVMVRLCFGGCVFVVAGLCFLRLCFWLFLWLCFWGGVVAFLRLCFCGGVFVARSVGEESCRQVLEKSVVEKRWRRVLERNVVQKCWRRVWRRGL